jgi:hypothetical protein
MELRYKDCQKCSYGTRKLAKQALRKISKQKGDGKPPPSSCYYCDDCNSWHLTSMPKQLSRDMQRFKNNKGLIGSEGAKEFWNRATRKSITPPRASDNTDRSDGKV